MESTTCIGHVEQTVLYQARIAGHRYLETPALANANGQVRIYRGVHPACTCPPPPPQGILHKNMTKLYVLKYNAPATIQKQGCSCHYNCDHTDNHHHNDDDNLDGHDDANAGDDDDNDDHNAMDDDDEDEDDDEDDDDDDNDDKDKVDDHHEGYCSRFQDVF